MALGEGFRQEFYDCRKQNSNFCFFFLFSFAWLVFPWVSYIKFQNLMHKHNQWPWSIMTKKNRDTRLTWARTMNGQYHNNFANKPKLKCKWQNPRANRFPFLIDFMPKTYLWKVNSVFIESSIWSHHQYSLVEDLSKNHNNHRLQFVIEYWISSQSGFKE